MEYLKGVFNKSFFGNSQETDEAHAGNAAERSEDMDPPGVTNKRVRDGSEHFQTTAAPPLKKQRRPSDDEYRLTGVGPPPMSSKPTPITFSNPYQQEESMVEQKKPQPAAGKTRKLGGGFKAQNTLGNAQAGKANRAANANMNMNNSALTSPARRAQEAAQAQRQVKAPLVSQFVGDGFEMDNRGTKRRKAVTSTPSKNRIVVELDSSGDEASKAPVQGRVHAVNGVPYSNDDTIVLDSQSQSQSQPLESKYFGAPEAKTVDFHVRIPRTKRPRRSSSNHRTTSHSSLTQNEAKRPTSATQHQPAGLEDLAQPSHLPGRHAPENSIANQDKKGRPPIDLDKGMDEIQQRKQDHYVKTMNDTVDNMFKKQTNSKQPQPAQSPGNRQGTTTQQQQAVESPLRHRFRREGSASQQHQAEQSQRPTLIDRMKPTSYKGERSGVGDSPDQLLGDNTVASRKHTSERSSRQTSPSDLRPTTFTCPNSKQPTGKSGQSAVKSNSRSDKDETRIPLKQIISRGCVLRDSGRGGSIELVWREEEFEVEYNGKPYCIPHKNEIMAIGSHEVSVWWSAKGSTKVMLKGPLGQSRSNGTILLLFQDISGKDECYLHLHAASNDTMNTRSQEPERMDQIFVYQSGEVQMDAQKRNAKAAAEFAESEKKETTMNAPVEDENIYEQPDDKAEHATSARSRMQGQPEVEPPQPTKRPLFDRTTATRQSTRQSKPVNRYKSPTPPPEPPKWTEIHKPEPWHQSILYPTQGARRVTVDFQDLERLDEGEFLNDNVVGYALRRIEEKMAPEHKNKVHFFNSFFYSALTNKNGRKSLNYDAIKKWTKSNDLFDIPYIVVPINENLHWYVAIVCNLPELARKPVDLAGDGSDAVATSSQHQQASGPPSPIKDPVIPDSQEENNIEKAEAERLQKLSLTDGDEAPKPKPESDTFEFGEDGNVVASSSNEAQEEELSSRTSATAPARGGVGGRKSKKRAPPPPKKYPVDRPTIVTLDSLNTAHTAPVSFLKDYVRAEADAKRGMTVQRDDIQGMKAVGIPVQSNFCDCGLYLVGYVEEFAKDPQAFVNKVLTRQLDQNSDFASFDPSKKRDELREDLIGLHAEQNAARLQQKKAKKMEKVAAAASALPSTAATASTTGQASTAPVTARASPADVQAPTTQSSKAASPVRARSPIVLVPRSGDLHAGSLPESRPDVIPGSANPVAEISDAHTVHEIDDSQELETSVPRPLVERKSEAASGNSEDSDPNQGKQSSTSSGGDEDEMLDSAGRSEANMQLQQRNFHKVRSPELEGLGSVLLDRQLGARSTSKPSSPEKRPS